MVLNVYSVGGTLAAPDDLVGTAYDIRTAISLLRLLRAYNCTGCKLQGSTDGGNFDDLTALSINDALLFLLAVLLQPAENDTELLMGAT